jgi:hypothetical protein
VSEYVRLHPDDKEDIACLMVNALIDRLGELAGPNASPQPSEAFNATAKDIASRCGVKAAWVREHAAELGGVRIGSGTKPRHRFSAAIATERITAMGSHDIGAPPADLTEKPSKRTPRRRSESAVPLLPIKGRMPT